MNVEGGGSAWPDMNHRLDNDQCAVLQAKLDVSDGIDKGSCACFYFGKTGCAKDKRAGVIGKCGWSHGAPADRKDPVLQSTVQDGEHADTDAAEEPARLDRHAVRSQGEKPARAVAAALER